MKKALLVLLALISLGAAAPRNLQVLFNSLDPRSIPEHLAFYELYPATDEGRQALKEAWHLILGEEANFQKNLSPLPPAAVKGIISMITKDRDAKTPLLSREEYELIDRASFKLLNRKLKGHDAKNAQEIVVLAPEEIDLARGLFLAKMTEGDTSAWNEMLSYEAMIDLMALQILTKIPLNASPEIKIREMNRFIFEEMGFRFPPHSLYAKDIDLYTFLPSVLDSQRGVCLGVSILYICLAQRLDLPLEMVTPPGHIYVRYNGDNKTINIETTARGIHIDSEEYLGIDTPYLKMRNIKEVIGLASFNEASVYFQSESYDKSLSCYLTAEKYLPEDALLQELIAYTYLFLGNIDEGKERLKKVLKMEEAKFFCHEGVAEDFLAGKVDVDGLKTVFLPVDETRESIIEKRKEIEGVINKFPQFCSGYFNLAITWLQLHRLGEALVALEKYHQLNNSDPKAEYYLTVLQASRFNYPEAWRHLYRLEELLDGKKPKILVDLKRELTLFSPE